MALSSPPVTSLQLHDPRPREGGRTGEAVNEQGHHHASNVCQMKTPPHIACSADPFVFGRKNPKNNALVPLIGH